MHFELAEIQNISYKNGDTARGDKRFFNTKPVTQGYKEMEIIIDNSLATLGAVTLVLLLLGGIYWNIVLHALLQKIKGDVRSLDGTVGKLIQVQRGPRKDSSKETDDSNNSNEPGPCVD